MLWLDYWDSAMKFLVVGIRNRRVVKCSCEKNVLEDVSCGSETSRCGLLAFLDRQEYLYVAAEDATWIIIIIVKVESDAKLFFFCQ